MSWGPGLDCHCIMTGMFHLSHGKAGLAVWDDTPDIAVSGSRVLFIFLSLGKNLSLNTNSSPPCHHSVEEPKSWVR